MKRRKRTVATALLLGAISLTACNYQNQSRVGGATGVTVDAAGKPVLLVAVCKGQFENIYLSTTETGNVVPAGGAVGKGGADRANTDIGEWQTERTADEILSVPVLSRPSAQWTVTAAPASLRPGVTYTAYAESTDTKWQATQVSFTVAQLKTLSPTTVRIGKTTTSRTMFRQQACGT